MAEQTSSGFTRERPPSPSEDVSRDDDVSQNNEDVTQNNEDPLGTADVGSSTSSNSLLQNFAERNDDEFDGPRDDYLLYIYKRLLAPTSGPFYLSSSDGDRGLASLPASSSSSSAPAANTESNDASTSNASKRWAEYAGHLVPPMRKRFGSCSGGDTNGNQSSLTGSTTIQDSIPSTSSDVQLPYPPAKDMINNWLMPRKSSSPSNGFKRPRLSHQTTRDGTQVEDSPEGQTASVLGGPSCSSTPTCYCNAPPPAKEVRWRLPEVQQLNERAAAAAAADLTTTAEDSVEVMNQEEGAAETNSGALQADEENIPGENTSSDASTNSTSESQEEEAGPSVTERDELPHQNIRSLNHDLVGLLECPVCLEYMGPPINQCDRGHLICSRCKPKLASCPTCRSNFSEQRNHAVEKVAEKLQYPCKNTEVGCRHMLWHGQRDQHEASCQHMTYRCAVVPSCGWLGVHHELLPHFRIAHSEALLFGPEHELAMILGNFREETSLNWVVSALGELFHVNLVAIRSGRLQVFGCVIFLGPFSRASHFQYSLTVGPNPDDQAQRSATFSRATHAYVEESTTYFSVGDCFHLNAATARLLCVGLYNLLKVQLKIERVEEC